MTMLTKALVAAVLVLGLVVGVQTWRLHRADAAQAEAALALTNEKAAHDTTRALGGRQLAALRTLYGDSLAAVTHLLQQRPVPQDGFSSANGSTTIGTTHATVGGTTAIGTATAAHPAASDSTPASAARVAMFDVRATPFTSHAVVMISPARDSIHLTTTLDRAELITRLECGTLEHGVRPASIVIAGPPWLSTTVRTGTLEPRLCNPDLGKSRRHWSLGITAGYGATLARDSTRAFRLYTGPSISAGITWTPF
jgi:hypothetical protein